MNVPSRLTAPLSGAARPQLLRFEEGQVLYEEGGETCCWYKVEEGVVRTCRFFPDGDRHVVGFFYPGDCFGLDPAQREENAEAVTRTKVWRRQQVDPDAADEVGEALEMLLQSTRAWLYLLGHRTAEQRLAAFLISLADRFETGGTVAVPMSRADIADHLRLTIHTVSRTISRLSQRDLIQFKTPQSFRIVDERRLYALAGRGQARI